LSEELVGDRSERADPNLIADRLSVARQFPRPLCSDRMADAAAQNVS
jgi:hypothetical protein